MRVKEKMLKLILLVSLIFIELITGQLDRKRFYLWCIDQCYYDWLPKNDEFIDFDSYQSCIHRCESTLIS